jgi:Cdc6-like AAA superfamily ATPase
MYKIAITGKANTGKNTLSKMLVKQLREKEKTESFTSVKYMAFADPIKEMIQIMFPDLPRKFLYGSSKYRNEFIPGTNKDGHPLTVRQLLIDLGTGVGRGYKENIWLDNFDNRFSKINSKIVVVTDVRFRNEFDHLKKKDFYQIRLYRETDKPGINHVSETNQNSISDTEYDYVIHNNGTLAELKKEVFNIVSRLKP